MLYHFGAADIRNETEADEPATGIPYSLLALKRMYAEWDAAVGDGWPTIYLGNHDQPRMVSRLSLIHIYVSSLPLLILFVKPTK